MNLPALAFPKPTAQVQPWFNVIGPELIVAFLLTFGGAGLVLSDDPKGKSRIEALIGYDKTRELAATAHTLPRRVPLAKRWLVLVLAWQGHSTAEIARQLRVSDVSVRKWRKGVAG